MTYHILVHAYLFFEHFLIVASSMPPSFSYRNFFFPFLNAILSHWNSLPCSVYRYPFSPFPSTPVFEQSFHFYFIIPPSPHAPVLRLLRSKLKGTHQSLLDSSLVNQNDYFFYCGFSVPSLHSVFIFFYSFLCNLALILQKLWNI